MSLKSWRKEFYPVPAAKPKTWLAAVRHSLRKWRGLRQSPLAAHGLRKTMGTQLISPHPGEFNVTVETCALCVLSGPTESGYPACLRCPLYKHLGDSCDGNSTSPYLRWYHDGDPEPMIKALELTEMKLVAGRIRGAQSRPKH